MAFEQVFAKTIICPNLEVAGAYVRSHQLSAITLDGDKVDKKGSISGGYQQSNRCRLDCVKEIKNWSLRYNEDAVKSREIKHSIRTLDQQITQLVGKIKSSESELQRKEEEREPLTHELNAILEDEMNFKKRLGLLESHLQSQQADVKNTQVQIESYQTEMKSKMLNTLSDEDFERIATLTAEMDALKDSAIQITQDSSEVGRLYPV